MGSNESSTYGIFKPLGLSIAFRDALFVPIPFRYYILSSKCMFPSKE